MVLLLLRGLSSSVDDRTLIWVHVQQNPCRRTQKPAARRRNEGSPQDTGRITTQKRPMTLHLCPIHTYNVYSTMQSSSARTGPPHIRRTKTHADKRSCQIIASNRAKPSGQGRLRLCVFPFFSFFSSFLPFPSFRSSPHSLLGCTSITEHTLMWSTVL